MHRSFTIAFVLVVVIAASGRRPAASVAAAQVGFEDNFEHGMGHWEPSAPARIRTIASGDPAHGQVLLLEPDGDDIYALIKGTDRWSGARLEGDVRFPTAESNLLGVIYNFQRSGDRADFGAVYIKGNDSYLQANPQHDFNVSRTLYPEFNVPLTGSAAIVTGRWQHFKVEVVGSMCHFYVGDMTTPRMMFPFFEGTRGSLGLHPRSVGGPVWVDNVRWAPLAALSYGGPPAPPVSYARETMLTAWDVAGPFTRVNDAIARKPAAHGQWRPLAADQRGAVVTATVTDFHGERTVAYLRARLTSAAERTAVLHFSTADDLALWVNGRFAWFIQRDGAAWYDFATNPKHASQKIPVDLVKGTNDIVIRVRGGAYATGAFFVRLDEAGNSARQAASGRRAIDRRARTCAPGRVRAR